MSYLTVPVEVVVTKTMEYRVIGPSDTEPKPAEGFLIDPEPIEIADVEGKFWIEYRIIE